MIPMRYKRRHNDIHWVRWFLKQMVVPLLIAMVGTGAGSFLIDREIARGWARVDDFRDMEESGAEQEECRDDHKNSSNP